MTDQYNQRPRRDPAASAPKISDADKLSAAELTRQRAQLAARPRRPRTMGGSSA